MVIVISPTSADLTKDILAKAQKIQFPRQVTDKVFLGFDAFIDTILSVVKVRRSPADFEIMTSMKEWADRINVAAGSSASIERILKRSAVGGFTCNVGKALATLCGRVKNVHLLGLFGKPTLRDIFQQQLVEQYQCEIFSMGNPGETDAYEFADGKVMMVNFSNVLQMNWAQILSYGDKDFLHKEYDASMLWGVGYWSETPNYSEIYTHLQEDIFPNLSTSTRGKHLMLDLADMRKRPLEMVKELLDILPKFEESVPTLLILNDLELESVGKAIGGNPKADPEKLVKKIREVLNLSLVFAHHPRWAVVSSAAGEVCVANAYTTSPQFTTSAGDHFDAGVCYGLMTGVDVEALPLLGNCVTSHFVRSGVSPTAQDLQQFLKNYPMYLTKVVNSLL